jgi:hypothetical protein
MHRIAERERVVVQQHRIPGIDPLEFVELAADQAMAKLRDTVCSHREDPAHGDEEAVAAEGKAFLQGTDLHIARDAKARQLAVLKSFE